MLTPSDAIQQLREQLTSDKRKLGFFLGAGTSKAIGIPDITELTALVEKGLDKKYKPMIDGVKEKCGVGHNIEKILNRVRQISALMTSDKDKYDGITGSENCKELDKEICKLISENVGIAPSKGYQHHETFARWLKHSQSSRQTSIEVFTTNYDLQLEKAFDSIQMPYFDGFLGGYNPFFYADSVISSKDSKSNIVSPPPSWLRLWKLHGSINWHLSKHGDNKVFTRASTESDKNSELMIFPSIDKYHESRRLPFLTLQDRFRDFLRDGELLLIICGYSFSDEHLNEIIFDSLNANHRLAITTLIFGDTPANSQDIRNTNDKILGYGEKYPNLTVLGPDKYSIGGQVGTWQMTDEFSSGEPKPFCDAKQVLIGDFITFVSFLKTFRKDLAAQLTTEKQ